MPMLPFNKPFIVGRELYHIVDAVQRGRLSGDGHYGRACAAWLQENLRCERALLTHSCTAALEMAALLLDLEPGDEVILPSYTFSSTANAFVLRRARLVFVDIREDTLNLDETLLDRASGPRTRAIVPVHYAGVGCEMDAVMSLARGRGLRVVEDAAQAVLATYKGRFLGTIGDAGTLSFHETKNLISGEGGAVLVNDPAWRRRAEVIWEKGTDRQRYFRGEVDKYTWVDLGSSFYPSELVAAFLSEQLNCAKRINDRRLAIWDRYHAGLADLEAAGDVRRPVVPPYCGHNAHMYYLLVRDGTTRERLLAHLKECGIHAIFHYVPLHSSPAGRRFGEARSSMAVTDRVSATLLRLPLFYELEDAEADRAIAAVRGFFGKD